MRGAPYVHRLGIGFLRIIPADAGSTSSYPLENHLIGDHPRGCGEHGCHCVRCSHLSGSSPRMRGARANAHGVKGMFGIIPADAGSTRRGTRPGCPGWDHPRGCGEHSLRKTMQDTLSGSSPRMRGAPCSLARLLRVLGIIPADAGSTLVPCRS